jgi:polyisoprenoid-binding protein YceI
MRKTVLPAVLALGFALGGPAQAAERIVHLDPEATRIGFDLAATGHDVHGLLLLQEGEIRFDPGTGMASGAIVVDARRADTGNKKRDKTMHGTVLESETFPLFRFTASRVGGTLVEDGTSKLEIQGTLSIHGTDHALVLPTTVEASNGRFEAVAKFSIPFVEWGMEDPSILFLRVAKTVDVTVETAGVLADGGEAAASNGAD